MSRPRCARLAAATASGLALTGVVPAPSAGAGSAPAGGTGAAAGFALLDVALGPRRAYVAGRPIAVDFSVAAPAPLDLHVDVVREATGRPVRRVALSAVVPGVAQHVEWDAVTGGGDVAPGGRYRIRVSDAATATARNAGRFTLRSHVYPVRGRHADRGPIGEFGVGRSGGRTHEGFDVNAACGTPLVAARGGVVRRAGYDPVLYGNVVIVRGALTQRDYWYSHLLRRPRLRVGDRVATGQRIGSIGATGNARTIGCHLHFEIHSRGRPIDPKPALHAWDAWS